MVADTILQEESQIKIGGRGFKVSPFSLNTFIKVGSLLSKMNDVEDIELDSEENIKKAIFTAFANAGNYEVLADILATFIMTNNKPKGWFKRKIYDYKYDKLVRWVKTLTGTDIYIGIIEFINNSDVASFFLCSTFPRRINLVKPTKVE